MFIGETAHVPNAVDRSGEGALVKKGNVIFLNPSSNHYQQRLVEEAQEIIRFLNKKTGYNYHINSKANINPVVARLKEGATVPLCKQVIASKCRQWLSDPVMKKYLRVNTLFRPTNFENYQGQCVSIKAQEEET